MTEGRYSTIELIIRDKAINIPSNEDSDKITIGDGIIYSGVFYRIQACGVRTEPSGKRVRHLEALSKNEEVNLLTRKHLESSKNLFLFSVYNLDNLILEWAS